MSGLDAKTDMIMKVADVRKMRILRRKLFRTIMRGVDVWRRGRLSGIPFKVLLYDNLVGVITSRHVTKMAVTLFDPPWPKTPCYMQTLQLSFL